MFAAFGIHSRRLEFCENLPREQYLRIFDRIDIALDPLPYNGITTTCDALWMGVPVISRVGERAAGRAGLGFLTVAGFPEWVAHSDEQFVKIAVDLANDLPRLMDIHATLRQRFVHSPVMDAARFARNVERAYRQVWQRWCDDVKKII